MKGSVERNIVAHLAWRYRYSLRAYFLVLYDEKSTGLQISLANCKSQSAWEAYYSSKRYI